MKTKLYPLDRIFDRTRNKYLSTSIIIERAKKKSENNALMAFEMNTKTDNRNVIEETVKEFLSDNLEFDFEKKDDNL